MVARFITGRQALSHLPCEHPVMMTIKAEPEMALPFLFKNMMYFVTL
jgi:hypothetical protein